MKNIILLLTFCFVSFNAFAQFYPSEKQYTGDKNRLINPSFEQGKANWTKTGTVTFTPTTVGSLFPNTQSMDLTFTNAATTARFGQAVTGAINGNQQYNAVAYVDTSTTNLAFGVFLNGVLTASVAIIPNIGLQPYSVSFTASGTSVEAYVFPMATITATAKVDEWNLGPLKAGSSDNVVITSGITTPKICSFGFGQGTRNSSCTSSPCSTYFDIGSCLNGNITRSGTGQYSITLQTNYFNNAYHCSFAQVGADVTRTPNFVYSSSTSLLLNVLNDTAGYADTAASIICHGY